jgi:hypothetical protein
MTGSGSATFSEPPRSAAGAGVPPGLPLDVASNQSVSRHGTERNHDLLHSGAHGQNAETKAGSAACTSESEGRTEGMGLVGWFVGRLRPPCEPRSRTQGTYLPDGMYARQSGYRAPSQSTRSSGPISPRRVIQNDTVAEGAGHPAARGPSHARWRIDHWNVLFHAGSPTLVPHFNRQMFLSSLKPRNTGEHVRTGKVLELMITVVLLRARPRKIFCQHDHCCPIEPRFRRFSS